LKGLNNKKTNMTLHIDLSINHQKKENVPMKIQKTILLSLSMTCAVISSMEKEYELLEQSTQQPSSLQPQIQSLITKKRIADMVYGTLVLGTATASICNVIWEEPTLKSDYFGANVLNVGNKINTAVTLGLGLADIIWLLKPYCAFSNDAAEEDTWAIPMGLTHLFGGVSRSMVATAVGICAGIRRYPHTLTMLTITGLLDFVGMANANNHIDITKEIEKLQSKSH
jgi:hypothetical protein